MANICESVQWRNMLCLVPHEKQNQIKGQILSLSHKFARCQVLYVSCNNSVNLYLLSTYYILGPAPLSRKFIDKWHKISAFKKLV